MSELERGLEIAQRYISLFNDPETPLAEFERLLSPEIAYHEMPNALSPQGSVRGKQQMLDGIEQGRLLLSSQSYEIVSALAQRDQVALEVAWNGVLAVGFGQIDEGTELSARIAMFLTIRDGQIVEQHNYDAYDPIG